MALPVVPPGYDSWNQYITVNAPALMISQGLTFQEAKASIKLLEVAMPVRQDFGTPSYRIYNEFTTWADRTVAPTLGRPWIAGAAVGDFLVTQDIDSDRIVTQDGIYLVT